MELQGLDLALDIHVLALMRAKERESLSDLNGVAAEQAADQIRAEGGIAEARQLDVTSRQEVERTISAIETEFGDLDCWHSNAGVSMNRFVDLSDQDWNMNMQVNAYGTFICGQTVARAMISRRRGCILNTASMASKAGNAPFLAHYVASKFAVMGLTQAMKHPELGPFGITVNCVCPGFVATAMQERELVWESELRSLDPADILRLWIAQTPLGRVETADDVAEVCVFLLSDSARFITGESLSVNGGARMD